MRRITLKNKMSNLDTGTYRAPIRDGQEFRMAGGCYFGTVVDKLGRYEDTGLEPEEIMKLIKMDKQRKDYAM